MSVIEDPPLHENLNIHYIISNYFQPNSLIKLDVNPLYQREIVWTSSKQGDLIDSLMKNYPIQSILINNDTINRLHICMDGKQRLTSINKFFNNEIYWINSNEHNIHVYFNNVDKKDKYSRIMNDEEKDNFLNRTLTIVKYKNLKYETQAEIFHRIQKGEYIHYSDLLISYFKKKEICQEFINGETKIFNLLERITNDNLSFILEKDYFRVFIINCICFMKNPWKVFHKNKHISFIQEFKQPEVRDILKDLFDIINIFELIKSIKLPKDYNLLIPIIFIANKYYKINYNKLELFINKIIKEYSNKFNLNDNNEDDLNEILIKLRNSVVHELGTNNIESELKKKTKTELHELMKSKYITEISKYNTLDKKIKRLNKYHSNFGLKI